jgi:ABC-type transporter Mla maintaining outer membrane lipid asymmetry permease subunit MlaE
MIVRGVYRCLVWLHPSAFRQRFGEEMVWIFDEAAGTWSAASLVVDAGMSLVRQRLTPSELGKALAAVIVGGLPVIIAFGTFIPWASVWRVLRSAF